MTNEEAIHRLTLCTTTCLDCGTCGSHDDALVLAITALREQAEIVKCKNCIYQKDSTVNCKGFVICPVSNMEITGNDFCSYGKRRESEVSE